MENCKRSTGKILVGLLLVGVFALGAGPALALERGDWLVRSGPTWVMPNDDSGSVVLNGSAIGGSEVGVNSAAALGVSLTYMLRSNWGVEVLAATPFKHEVSGGGALAGLGTIAEVQHLPPTVTLQYHFSPLGQWRPYLGVGLNYTTFFSESGRGVFAGAEVDLQDSWGPSLQVGLDFDLSERWFVGASLYYMLIDTSAKIQAGADTYRVEVDINPWVAMLGAGFRF